MTTTNGDVLAVACQNDCTVVFLDIDTGRRLDTIAVAPEPHEATYDAARRLIYVSHTYHAGWYFRNSGRTSMISVIDADARKVVDMIDIAPDHGPHDLRWDAASDVLHVSVESGEGRSGALLVIDPGTRTVRDRVPVDADGPHWFAVSPDGSTIYTANKESPFVSVVDVAGGRMTGRVAVPGSEGIAVLPGGDRIVVAGPVFRPGPPRAENGLRVIDAAAGAVTQLVGTGQPVTAVHVTTAGALLVSEVPGEAGPDGVVLTDGMLRIHDPGTLELRGRVPVGAGALTVRSSADGALAFVANLRSATVTVIDVDALRVLRTDDVDAGAHGLAIIPA